MRPWFLLCKKESCARRRPHPEDAASGPTVYYRTLRLVKRAHSCGVPRARYASDRHTCSEDAKTHHRTIMLGNRAAAEHETIRSPAPVFPACIWASRHVLTCMSHSWLHTPASRACLIRCRLASGSHARRRAMRRSSRRSLPLRRATARRKRSDERMTDPTSPSRMHNAAVRASRRLEPDRPSQPTSSGTRRA